MCYHAEPQRCYTFCASSRGQCLKYTVCAVWSVRNRQSQVDVTNDCVSRILHPQKSFLQNRYTTEDQMYIDRYEL
ncbi:hypothetical protein PsYK624_161980 [Phanerochaete sordida]|uniref:Uncharacterized protein n=1 Tax=Phanerochaete sordida TaxID=48140 RepID=A0A9P3GRU9_9APHY|nr:hypothetical protein PsYK624_161980 [Phanerochaete sordida]